MKILEGFHKSPGLVDDKWVVIDDNVSGITPFVSNVVKCRGWLGLTWDEYDEIKKILSR